MTTAYPDVSVIDTDSHVVEPTDLWTSRLASKWLDYAPHVVYDDAGQCDRWQMNGGWLTPVARYGHAGWREPAPACPPTLAEADPASWNPVARLERMDEYGIAAQVLYPNLIAFETAEFLNIDPEFALACTVAYNDFLTEFASTDPRRLIPIAMLPFWDIDAALVEMKRCKDAGHKGVLFGNRYERIGMPTFYDPHWEPLLARAEVFELSINFHIGFSSKEAGSAQQNQNVGDAKQHARSVALTMLGQGQTIAEILTTGICDRHPTLNFVSVESGFGYLPYLLESLDWHFDNFGGYREFPDALPPSEYFRRQVYGSFWFETTTLPLLELYPDNFMFETDFPHPTSLSPGPASNALPPSKHIERYIAGLDAELVGKVLYENAARLYHVDLR
jgi:predicted TIM-barrel fold metal-dependent hydrolase